MNLVQLQREIAEHFPKVWIKEGSLFSNAHCESLWTGEGSEVDVVLANGENMGTIPVFDMYPEIEYFYEFGVLKEFAEFLRARGYYAEAHDPGTFFIWQA
jgi:hypothetical protein